MRSFRLRLGLLTAGGIGARALYVALTSSPSSFPVGGDAAFYQFTAEHLSAGDGYISPVKLLLADEVEPTAEHPPLFSLFLAVLIKLGANSTTAQRLLIACGVGALVIVGLGLLGRRVGGERAGLIAAALGAFFPTIITAQASLESEALYGILLVLALLAAYRLHDRRDTVSAVALGVAIGVAALARNEALLLLALLGLPLALSGGAGSWRRLAVSCAIALAFVAPWVVRNSIVMDRPLLSTNYGQGLAGSNCHPTYFGSDMGGFSILCFRLDPERNEADWAADLASQGIRYAREHAARVPLVMAVRALRGWGFYAPASQLHIYNMSKPVQHVGIAFWYPLLGLALAGLVLLHRRRQPLAPLLAPLLVTSIVLIVYSGVTRYRHGSELAMVVLAAVTLEALARRIGGSRRARLGSAAHPRRASR
jgi:4-amino-4-deoxy-L-arabinose transferase-like glycosyltransferase